VGVFGLSLTAGVKVALLVYGKAVDPSSVQHTSREGAWWVVALERLSHFRRGAGHGEDVHVA